MIWLPNALPSIYSVGFICTSCLRPCYVMLGPSSSWHCVGITHRFANSSNSQSYLCIGRTLGRQFSKWNTLFLSPALLGLPARLSQRRSQGEWQLAEACREMFVREKLWKHDCLFFTPPDWHWSWLMFSSMWAVINFGLVSQTDTCGACQATPAPTVYCHTFHLMWKWLCVGAERFLGRQRVNCKHLYLSFLYVFKNTVHLISPAGRRYIDEHVSW